LHCSRYVTSLWTLPNGNNSNNFSQSSLHAISPFILDINRNMGKIKDSVER
jgi:hypothetical protein